MALRVAENKLRFIGYVKEVDLEKVSEMNDQGERIERIKGVIKIKVREDEVSLSVNVNRFTKSGTESKNYIKLEQLLTGEAPSLAKDPENPTTIKVFGNNDFTPQIRENRYYNKNTKQAVARLGFTLGFGTIVLDNSIPEEDHEASFSVEGFVKSVEPEVKIENGEEVETGRAVVDLLVPAYDSEATTVFPMRLVAGTVDGTDLGAEVLDGIENGESYNFQGNIVNRKVVTITKKKGIGRAKIEEKEEYIREYSIVGGQNIDNESLIFDEESIGKAFKERKINLENIEEEGKANDTGDSKNRQVGIKTNPNKSSGDSKPRRTFDF